MIRVGLKGRRAMNIWMKTTAVSLVAVSLTIASLVTYGAQAADVTSLRGNTGIADNNKAAELHKGDTGDRFGRAYRQQPPLIPHDISTYQIDLKANQCIGCHDWPQNTVAGAPKISETHYIGREGQRLNHVSTARWFCTQCHVPQAKTKELVGNDFQSAAEMY